MRSLAAAILGFALVFTGQFVYAQDPEAGEPRVNPPTQALLFTEQNKLILFSGPDVNGVITGIQTGTTTGNISGDVLVNFRYFVTGPTTFNFDVRTGITDTAGDQLIYRATGTG